jgi:acylphosphatase
MPRIARHVRVTGRVQGVFFRAWTREQAKALGLNGWVRNCPDGSVEALVEGEAEPVDQLVDLMRRGPSGARVDNLEIVEAEPEQLSSFDVRH